MLKDIPASPVCLHAGRPPSGRGCRPKLARDAPDLVITRRDTAQLRGGGAANNEAECRKVFDFAKEMGIQVSSRSRRRTPSR